HALGPPRHSRSEHVRLHQRGRRAGSDRRSGPAPDAAGAGPGRSGVTRMPDERGTEATTPADATAELFVERLTALRSEAELEKIQRYFRSGKGEYGEGDQFLGVRMGDVFALAKELIAMPPAEIEKLLESPLHEVRA